MKKYIFILFGGAMLFWGNPTSAKPYYLYCNCNIDNKGQGTRNGSRMPKHPLCVDLTGNLMTVPSQVLGYTLTLMGEEGKVYTYVLSSDTIVLPKSLVGEFDLQISNGNKIYEGEISM